LPNWRATRAFASAFEAPTIALGVDSYGQSGTRQELYDHYGIGLAAMQRAALASIEDAG
jgi:pyruvate dehydrogenase complex dehydrogenase (E1) component